jgi:hypothetical protein
MRLFFYIQNRCSSLRPIVVFSILSFVAFMLLVVNLLSSAVSPSSPRLTIVTKVTIAPFWCHLFMCLFFIRLFVLVLFTASASFPVSLSLSLLAPPSSTCSWFRLFQVITFLSLYDATVQSNVVAQPSHTLNLLYFPCAI